MAGTPCVEPLLASSVKSPHVEQNRHELLGQGESNAGYLIFSFEVFIAHSHRSQSDVVLSRRRGRPGTLSL